MSASPKEPNRPPSILARMAYGSGAALRGVIGLVTLPYRALFRRGRRRARPSQGAGNAILRRQRLDLEEVRRRAGAEPVRFEAAHVAADEGLSALSSTLSDPDPSSRMLALDVVCELSGERAARLLGAMLHDPEPTVRSAAARAAARIRASGAVFSLILTLEDPAEEVRVAAARAIEDITGRHVPPASDPALARDTVGQLKRWWKERRYAELAAARRLGPPP